MASRPPSRVRARGGPLVSGRSFTRAIYIEPTARGKSLLAEYEKKLSKYVENGMAGMKPAEQEKIIELIAIFSSVDEN